MQSRDQFLTIDETASLLGIDAADLRQGIACGLVPIRRDNHGELRIHRAEVPEDLLEQIAHSEIDPRLHVESLVDEVSMLREQVEVADKLRLRLEQVLEQQATALARSGAALDQNESHIAKLTTLLESSMQLLDRITHTVGAKLAINEDAADTSVAVNAIDTSAEPHKSFVATTDKAMQLLERAVNDAEKARSDVVRMSALMDRSLSSSARIESEIDQRNSVIDKQHELINRLVSVSEQSLGAPKVKAKRKRSFWQRLWGGGKGI